MNKQERDNLFIEYAKWDLDDLPLPERFKEVVSRIPELLDLINIFERNYNNMSVVAAEFRDECHNLEDERDHLQKRCEALERAISGMCIFCTNDPAVERHNCRGWQFDEARFADGGG